MNPIPIVFSAPTEQQWLDGHVSKYQTGAKLIRIMDLAPRGSTKARIIYRLPSEGIAMDGPTLVCPLLNYEYDDSATGQHFAESTKFAGVISGRGIVDPEMQRDMVPEAALQRINRRFWKLQKAGKIHPHQVLNP